jgi:hypothetical protein
LETEVAYAVDNTDYWAGVEVVGPGMSNNLATNAIFLCSERESDEGDPVEVIKRTSERVYAIVSDEELDVA